MDFVPLKKETIKQMMSDIGIETIDKLYSDLPHISNNFSKSNNSDLPQGLRTQGHTEIEAANFISSVSKKNRKIRISLLGGGIYHHFIPAAVKWIANRSEFLTAYTPYQAEMSQGILQAIYEYQSIIANLTGLDVSNASLYDGSTALVEAVIMATRIKNRDKIIISGTLNPEYITVLKTYNISGRWEIVEVKPDNGTSDIEKISDFIDDRTAAVVFKQPTFFGTIDDFENLIEKIHKSGSLVLIDLYPISLGILKPPGELGADIVIGEGQPLGLPPGFGGPLLGFIATRKEFLRAMPGRIAGKTKDLKGNEGYVLTLQAREQHIRREKAGSNICSNEALCALMATVYLSSLGDSGLEKVAKLSLYNSHYLTDKLKKIDGIKLMFDKPFFNEFVLKFNDRKTRDRVIEHLINNDIAFGIPLDKYFKDANEFDPESALLVAVTELHTKEILDEVAERVEEAVSSK